MIDEVKWNDAYRSDHFQIVLCVRNVRQSANKLCRDDAQCARLRCPIEAHFNHVRLRNSQSCYLCSMHFSTVRYHFVVEERRLSDHWRATVTCGGKFIVLICGMKLGKSRRPMGRVKRKNSENDLM
ncbi:hypothetical protein AB6A40_001647 [Gnathostoma spinigerum]|uniref:Uncharacterized protein n=1 Tax=Gnathostoma spinigerum TaxID=75299 RepID=A0ABD6EDL3_9BILA